jgi:hypothetical protein
MTPDAEHEDDQKPTRLVLTGKFLRQRSGKSVTFASEPPPPKPQPVRRPAHVARQLALAHHLQRAVDQGLVADRAAVARKLGLTRARVTQLLDLLLLAPDLQLNVLSMEAVDGVEPTSERPLRKIAHDPVWHAQRARFTTLLGSKRAWAAPLS